MEIKPVTKEVEIEVPYTLKQMGVIRLFGFVNFNDKIVIDCEVRNYENLSQKELTKIAVEMEKHCFETQVKAALN